MKISVSLPEEDVAFVDEYVAQRGASSRSSVVHQAIALLREHNLEKAYAEAWDEWAASGEGEVWDAVTGDGVIEARGVDAAR